MFRNRRVGTLTTGIILVGFGGIFIARHILPFLSYTTILSLWPLVLILLGFEIIISYIINKENAMKYDGWAIVLTIMLSFFAMFMAGVEFTLNHFPELSRIF